jgi:hypothetical protein
MILQNKLNKNLTKNPIFVLIMIFSITRIALFFFPWIFRIFFSETHIYPSIYSYLIDSWNYWDAPHFLYVAQNWYTNQGDPSNFIVFLPFYPMLVAGAILFVNNPVIAGILVSFVSFILAIPILFKLSKYFMSKEESFRSIWLFMIFPTSLFLTAPYSESVFILLWSIAFLAAFEKKWYLSGMAIGFAAITRNFGVLIVLPVLIEWFLSKKRKYTDLFFILIPIFITLSGYFMLNKYIYNDPFAFQKILHEHWQKTFSFPITSFVNTWKIALNNPLDPYSLSVGWAEGIAMLISYLLIPLAYKKLPKSLFIYHVSATLLISSTSFILSSPRYLISIPTIFLILGKTIKNEIVLKIVEFVSIGILFLLTYIYTRGQWAF